MATETHAAAHPEAGHGAHGAVPYLHHHFDDLEQQRETTSLAMWGFLATEAMMFGGLFLAYSVYRFLYPMAYAEGSHHLKVALGTINTFILLTSSFFMAMAVHAASTRNRKLLLIYLCITWIFAAGFLVVKGFEWTADYHEGLVPAIGGWHYYDEPGHVGELIEQHTNACAGEDKGRPREDAEARIPRQRSDVGLDWIGHRIQEWSRSNERGQ